MRPFFIYFLCLCFLGLHLSVRGQQIRNTKFSRTAGKYQVTYDMGDSLRMGVYDVQLFYSPDSGATMIGPLKQIKGDVGRAQIPGMGKEIWWAFSTENGAPIGKKSLFEVRAHQKHDSILTETVQGVSFNMVFVEGGSFQMGSPSYETGRNADETPHRVWLDNYYIGQTEVTIGLYLEFARRMDDHYPEWLEEGNSYNINGTTIDKDYYRVKGMSPSNPDYPVTGVSWYDAMEFCYWLSAETGKEYRLCTEAEWEYAARGGNYSKGYRYAGSDTVGDVAWYAKNSNNTAHAVMQLQPNELGIFDMSGNIWEWCLEWYDDYGRATQSNPEGPVNGTYRVDRGGAWSTFAERCRVAYRLDDGPELRDFNLGFRVCLIP